MYEAAAPEKEQTGSPSTPMSAGPSSVPTHLRSTDARGPNPYHRRGAPGACRLVGHMLAGGRPCCRAGAPGPGVQRPRVHEARRRACQGLPTSPGVSSLPSHRCPLLRHGASCACSSDPDGWRNLHQWRRAHLFIHVRRASPTADRHSTAFAPAAPRPHLAGVCPPADVAHKGLLARVDLRVRQEAVAAVTEAKGGGGSVVRTHLHKRRAQKSKNDNAARAWAKAHRLKD